jgi:hypothetical protein
MRLPSWLVNSTIRFVAAAIDPSVFPGAKVD